MTATVSINQSVSQSIKGFKVV